jgi:hypothetical protein
MIPAMYGSGRASSGSLLLLLFTVGQIGQIASAVCRRSRFLLAGIGMEETGHVRNTTASSVGALGLMQFMPAIGEAASRSWCGLGFSPER